MHFTIQPFFTEAGRPAVLFMEELVLTALFLSADTTQRSVVTPCKL